VFIMIIFSSLFFFLVVYDFKKGVMIALSSLVFLPYLTSGIPGVKLYTLLCCFIVLIFFFKRKSLFYKVEPYPVHLLFPSIITTSCYLISNYFATRKETVLILVNCIVYFFIPYVFWHCIKTHNDLRQYLKYLYIVSRNFF
jgi:hypothetical protein